MKGSRPTCDVGVSLTTDLFAYCQLHLDCPSKATTIQCQACADTGAEACIISNELFQGFGIDSFPEPPSTNIYNFDGSKLDVLGCCLLRISDPEQTGDFVEATQQFYISGGQVGVTLSLSCSILLGIVPEDFPRLKKKEEGKEVKEKDADISKDPGNVSKETGKEEEHEVEKEEEDGEEKQETEEDAEEENEEGDGEYVEKVAAT